MNIVQFANEFGGVTRYDVLGHIHANLGGSGKENSSQHNRYLKELDRLVIEEENTSRRYEEAIKQGIISRPKELSLKEIALGNPDLESTQAALRLLAKRGRNV